ncbi:hypothetical protein [Phenylobacterium sp.]|uniref:hypothetical protein n=1 Tax=Phenylobacterium sp. TaxID=1871053 RepID=UPI0012178579|nr:hypothetical protein [Phenylobacterium sp.]THD64613.1 MAG: hypothetical protein E8A49_00735 [Phenylobacterium sp.]
MRAAVLILILAAASPAAAQPILGQPYYGLTLNRDPVLDGQAEAARQRAIGLDARTTRLETQGQTNAALANIAAARVNPGLPTVPLGAYAKPPIIDVSQLPKIPDATLAASNARILAAANNRH